MAKITRATFKSFIKTNRENLLIKKKSNFDGMCDGLVYTKQGFEPIRAAEFTDDCNFGIAGVWLVGGRDYFTAYEKDGLKGIEVSNCCGNFIVAVA